MALHNTPPTPPSLRSTHLPQVIVAKRIAKRSAGGGAARGVKPAASHAPPAPLSTPTPRACSPVATRASRGACNLEWFSSPPLYL